MDVTQVFIQPLPVTGSYGTCRVYLQDGTVLIERSRDPEHDACRALLARGIKGRLETYLLNSSVRRMRLDIEAGAELTVTESARRGLQVVRWTPHPGANALSREGAGQVSASGSILEVEVATA